MNIPPGSVSNGLPAEDWARLDSVPFPIMQHLLVALRAAGIAAYAVSDIDESPLRALNRRSPLNQRIYVERARVSAAREILTAEVATHEEALLSSAVDTDFANLIAHLSANDATDASEGALLEQIPELREEHFEPPMPEIHYSADPVTRAAWVGVLGGPVLLLLSLFGVLTLGGMAPMIAIAAFMAGFITLVVRMPDRLPVDEGPDDGAVV